MNEQEFAELAAGYATNALSPEDLEAFEVALIVHPEWTHLVQTDAATVTALAEATSPVAPPFTMRSVLLSKIATLPQDGGTLWSDSSPTVEDDATAPETHVAPIIEDAPATEVASVVETAPEVDSAPVPTTEPGPMTQLLSTPTPAADEPEPPTSGIQAVSRRNWTRGLFTLAASLVLLVAIGFGAANLNQWIGRPPAVVALQEIEAAPDAQSATVEVAEGGGVATAHWSGSLGKAVLVADGLPTIASGETYELWFVREDGTPVSAGLFEAAGQETTALLAGTMEAGDIIAVTIEEAGGSPTGVPTTDPIVAIPTV